MKAQCGNGQSKLDWQQQAALAKQHAADHGKSFHALDVVISEPLMISLLAIAPQKFYRVGHAVSYLNAIVGNSSSTIWLGHRFYLQLQLLAIKHVCNYGMHRKFCQSGGIIYVKWFDLANSTYNFKVDFLLSLRPSSFIADCMSPRIYLLFMSCIKHFALRFLAFYTFTHMILYICKGIFSQIIQPINS